MIVCSYRCVYQTEGVCQLDRAASAGHPVGDDGCIHYIPCGDAPNAVEKPAGKNLTGV